MEFGSQSCRLQSLPNELILVIAEFADFASRLSLSATNSTYRALLLKCVFQTLKITSDESEANEILAIASKIGSNVQAVSFHGTAGPNPRPASGESDEDQSAAETITGAGKYTDKQSGLPPAAAALLSGEHLPNVTTLIVKFDFDFEIHDNSGTWDSRDEYCDGISMYVFSAEETTSAVVDECEEEFPWRRLMAQTWASASKNKNINKLVIEDLIPKPVSSWFTSEWYTFLAQIEEADIQMWGSDNGADFECGTLPGYMYFLSQLDAYFFNGMENTKKLRLSCYKHAPLGSIRTFEVEDTMSLRPESLPRIEELRLENAIPCPELVAFFESKSKTIRDVEMHECFVSREYPRVRLSWADFFAGLRRSDVRWRSFSVTYDAAPPLTFNEHYGTNDEEEEHESIQSVRNELAKDPNKRLFLYAELVSKYGYRSPEFEEIQERFEEGSDMEEFNKLMSVVGESRKA